GHAQSWLILAAVSLIGMAVRHTFNLRNKGRAALGYCFSGAAVAGMIALVYASAPRFESDTVDANEPVAFATVKAVIDLRCVPCHSVKPRHEDFDKPPEGVMFDTPQQIKTRAQRIFARTVVSQTMPLGDETSMSQEERDLLGVWVRQGAPLE
ncbi:MAG: cysteine desulfurase, partial [Rhodospirillales bacterium]|nr:cysteine desulfurase [Rhodospirillales bacterium]